MSVVKLKDTVETRIDSFINALTGLGTFARDKVQSAVFQADSFVADQTLDALYQNDDMAARIIEALPLDAWRQGYALSLELDDESESLQLAGEVEEFVEKTGFRDASMEAMFWARLYGAGAVYVIADDGLDQGEPLNLERIRSIVGLQSFDRRDLRVFQRYADPMSSRFGEPEIFELTLTNNESRQGILIHETRLIQFHGVKKTRSEQNRNSDTDWGGHSVMNRVMNPLRDFQVFWQALAHLVQDSAQGVFKMEGLIDMIASGNKDALASRMQVVDLGRSISRSLMLDAKMESFERQPHNMGGLENIADRFSLRLAAAARMPVTLLMGQSPAGMNATGESDTRNWHDQVRQYQQSSLRPALMRFLEIAMSAQDAPTGGVVPETWSIDFVPLLQQSEKEQAELRKMVADADQIYVNLGVLLPEEVALNRFPASGWSAETSIDLSIREEMLDAEKERELQKLSEPDPEPPPVPPVPSPDDGDEDNEGQGEQDESEGLDV